MTPSSETLLVLGAIGLYLVDSAILLYSNEVVFSESHGRWSWSCGSPWQILRKNPYLPNPLTPDSLVFRASWSVSPSDQREDVLAALGALGSALAPLRYMVVILLVLLGLGLPLFVYSQASNALVLLAIAIYGIGLAIAVLLYRRRSALGLGKGAMAELAIEAVLCPPLALNVVRKITLRRTLIDDPIAFAQNALRRDRFLALLAAIEKWIEEELHFEEDGSARREELHRLRERLGAMQA